jgi:hypothetical protein
MLEDSWLRKAVKEATGWCLKNLKIYIETLHCQRKTKQYDVLKTTILA